MHARRARGFATALRPIAFIAALGLSERALGLDAIFGDGFDDRACAWSGAPPPQGQSCGPGHLVLIGHDYAPVLVLRGDPDRQQAATLTDLEQVLVNAVAQTRAAQLPRAIRIAVLDVNTEADELDAVLGFLAGALTVQTTPIAVDDVPPALTNSDVLLIPDQNGLFDGQAATLIAAQLAPLLRSFLDRGGVVVVLDGIYDPGDGPLPSANYRILDRELLAIDAAQRFDGCAQVPCNDADPLLAAVAHQVCVFDHVVEFISDEPWITFSHQAPDQTHNAFVLHRWFGASDQGPIAMDIDVGDTGGEGLSGNEVFFQQANGAPTAQCTTLSNGTAVHEMAPNSFASLGLYGSGSRTLVTVLQAQPGDHLRFVLPLFVLVQPLGSVVVDLPDSVPDAASYRVMVGCGEQSSNDPTTGIGVNILCTGQDGTYSVVGEALDANRELLAYTILNGVTETQGSEVVMPAWKPPNLEPSITAVEPDLQSIDLAIELGANGIDYQEGGGSISRGNLGDTFSFYSESGIGAPPFTQLTHRARARFDPNGQPFEVQSERTVRGPLIGALPIDLDTFLPRITDPFLSFGADDRMVLFWVPGSLSGIDGGTLQVSWSNEASHQWVLVFPSGSPLIAPPDPGQLGDLFWPGPSDYSGVGIVRLQLDDATFLPSYRDYRQEILGVTRPPATNYILRSTLLIAPP